jgi:hypothetical protein
MNPLESDRQGVELREARRADAPALAPLLAELGFPAPPAMIAERLDAMGGER